MWRNGGNEQKFHLLNWAKVCSPIQFGRLGLKRLPLLNKALLGKWLWCFAAERDNILRIVISKKTGSSVGGWNTLVFRDSYGVSLWKHISNS